MTDYVLCDSDGKIVMAGSCPSNQLEYQKRDGLELIECKASLQDDYYCHDSKQVKAKPNRPSDLHVFCYKSKLWVIDEACALDKVRERRDKLLAESDWAVMPDAPMSDEVRQKWLDYRQALRDITKLDVNNITLPDKPQEG